MTRILIDIPDATVKKLDEMAAMQKLSRAKVVRLALSEFVKQKKERGAEEAFGILRDENIDALAIQQKLRDEW